MTELLNRPFLKEEKHLMSSSKMRVSAEIHKGKIIIDDYALRKEVRAVVVNISERDFSALKECCPNIYWSKARVDSTLIKN